jgi:hypothetical protein
LTLEGGKMHPRMMNELVALTDTLERLLAYCLLLLIFALVMTACALLRRTYNRTPPKVKGVCPDCRRMVACLAVRKWMFVNKHHKPRSFQKCSGEDKVAVVFCETCKEGFAIKSPEHHLGSPRIPFHKKQGAVCFGYHRSPSFLKAA